MRRHAILLLVMSLIASGSAAMAFDGLSGSECLRYTPPVLPDYHPSYVTLNITYENGTPFTGMYAGLYRGTGVYEATTNGTGSVVLNATYLLWGDTEIIVYDGSFNRRWVGDVFIGPDEEHFFDVVIGDLPVPYNEVFGTVTDRFSGAPLKFVDIAITGHDVWGNSFTELNHTETDGSFSFIVPNSTKDLDISTGSISGYGNHYGEMFLEQDKDRHRYDIKLVPDYKGDSFVNITLRNSTSGRSIEDAYVTVSGNAQGAQNTYYSRNVFSNSTGAMNCQLGTGEYRFYFNIQDPYWNAYHGFEMYYHHNGSDRFMEYDIPVREFMYLEVEVWNDTSPLYHSRVSWEKRTEFELGVLSSNAGVHTNLSGRTVLGVDAWETTNLSISSSGHRTKYVDFYPIIRNGIRKVNVTLEELEPVSPIEPEYGPVEIHVRDSETGVGLPLEYVNGNGKQGDIWVSFNNKTNETGVFKGDIPVGYYSYMYSSTSLGYGEVRDVTMTTGDDPVITIYVERRSDSPGEPVWSHFAVRSPDGNPLPGQWLYFSPYNGEVSSFTIRSDEEGLIHFKAPPGKYSIDSRGKEDHRPLKVSPYMTIEVGEEGGQLDDVICYDASPLYEINGMVRDAATGEVIKGAGISVRSFYELSRNIMFMWEPEYPISDFSVLLYNMGTGSDPGGFYRGWGKDTVILHADKHGYFPAIERLDIGTRATTRDILMEEIPERSTWINGTLMDQDGEPIAGEVIVSDDDHYGMPVDYAEVDSTGLFSIQVYPGAFTLRYSNDTLSGEKHVTAGGTPLTGVSLRLIPLSVISGVVTNWNGTPLEGMNVTITAPGTNWTGDHRLTDEEGLFSFELTGGTYRITIEGTGLYDRYESSDIVLTGWNDPQLVIKLMNRTTAIVAGQVLAGGGLEPDIPHAEVELLNSADDVVGMVEADGNGYYIFEVVPHGTNYSIRAYPPVHLRAVEGIRSGYLMNTSEEFTVEGYEVEADLYLPYEVNIPPMWLNITIWSPQGSGVPLDEPILMQFSLPVNTTLAEDALSISPVPGNLTFVWNKDHTIMQVDHDLFKSNTTYEVSISDTLLSYEGYPLWNNEGVSWNFTTGDYVSQWRLYTASQPVVGDDRSVEFTVTGKPNISIYLNLSDGETFRFYPFTETVNGTYALSIPGGDLEWDTWYNYHFTDSEWGGDLARVLAGSFRTPRNPAIPPGWEIFETNITFTDEGGWVVSIGGNPNMTVYIVIEGVGPFLLEPRENGTYVVYISSDEFEGGKVYNYYFSDSPDGPDLAPGFSGSVTAMEKEGDGERSRCPLVIAVVIIIVLILLVLAVLIVLFSKKGSKGEGFEGEDEFDDEE